MAKVDDWVAGLNAAKKRQADAELEVKELQAKRPSYHPDDTRDPLAVIADDGKLKINRTEWEPQHASGFGAFVHEWYGAPPDPEPIPAPAPVPTVVPMPILTR